MKYAKNHRILSLLILIIIGRQYDKEGNVRPWWSEETIAAFDERAQCFIDMYDNYTVPELIPILGDDAHVSSNY